MDTPKLKNIIIIILLLVNAFLLAMMISDSAQAGRERRLAEEKLKQVLSEQGVELSEDVNLELTAPASCTVVRDMDKELQLMRALIGAESAENQGGNIYHYEGDGGQAVARSTGETDILFSGGGERVGGDIGAGTVKLFKKGKAELIDMGGGDQGDWLLCSACGGYPVYNAELEVSYYEDTVQLITGVLALGSESFRPGGSELDCVTALMRFVRESKESGYVYSRIEDVSAGYIMSVTMPGEYSLKSVWRIEMDTGTVYTGGETGLIEDVAQ